MARLGSAESYTAEVHLRGGRVLWTPLEGITGLSWGRKLGDYSEATVSVGKATLPRECWGRIGDVINSAGMVQRPGTHTWSHELTIRRDGGIVWQGPITEPSETGSEITFAARDMLAWTDRRITDVGFINETDPPPPHDAGDLLKRLMEVTFPLGDPINNNNMAEHWRIDAPAGRQYVFGQNVCQGSATVGSLVRDIAKVGIDLFTMGRKIYMVPNWYRIGQSPYRLHQNDFLGDLEVREGGLDMCTEGYAYGKEPGQGECAEFGAWPNPDGIPPPPGWASQWFGRVSKWQEAQEANDKVTLNTMARALHEYGWPPPRAVVIPQQGQLSPDAPVGINQLVPGRPFRVSLPDYVFAASSLFRLNEVEVTWSPPDPEQVQLSLVSANPPPDDDQPTEHA